MRQRLPLPLLLLLFPMTLAAQEVKINILKPYDRVYYNSNIPSVEVMAYAGRYFNSHGELECTVWDRERLVYKFSQDFMAAMGDSARLSFSFNLEPGFYRVELKKDGDLANECVIGYEPELIGREGVVRDSYGNFEKYWSSKIEELATYPSLTKVERVKQLSKGARNLYRVTINSFGGKSLKGYYAVPKEKGLYRVILKAIAPSDSLSFEKLGRIIASDTLTGQITFVAEPKESLDILRFIDFLQEQEEVSLGNIFLEGEKEAACHALVAAAIDRRISAVALYAPKRPEYEGADREGYGNPLLAAANLAGPLLFGVDITGKAADPAESFLIYNSANCRKTYYIFLEGEKAALWRPLKENFFDEYTTHLY